MTGQRQRFASAILPAWARKSPKVAEVLPLLYLHGLSAATITRLTKDWQDEAVAFNKRSLAETDYVYVWVDGIHLKVRLEQDKVCLLVMIGVRADGTKELVALDDGHRESTESWLDLLRSCKRRGMRAPVLAVGDGALGFWAAVREVFPEAREQRCWFHKIANVLNCRPSPPSGSVSGSPRAPARGPPGWPWRSSSSSQHKLGGAQSTRRTWSRWSAPARSSRRASWLNETTNSPTTMTRNQEVTLTPRDTPIQRS